MAKEIEIPQEGCDVLLSGKDKDGKALSKTLHVTPAKVCSDWLKLKLDDSGHETLEVAGVADHAKSLGFDSVKLLKSEPKAVAPKPEPGKPLPVAMKAGK